MDETRSRKYGTAQTTRGESLEPNEETKGQDTGKGKVKRKDEFTSGVDGLEDFRGCAEEGVGSKMRGKERQG